MSVSHRRAAPRLLTVVTLGALVLTGCGEKGEEPTAAPTAAVTDTAPAGGGGAAAPSGGGEGSQNARASTSRTPWAGTKQFVTIDRAWSEDGLTRLSVRPAQKKVNTRFDTWEITPGTGSFTTVTMAEDARVMLTTPVRGEDTSGGGRAEPLPFSQAEFVTLLKQMDSTLSAGVGYDLSFDGAGQVVKLQSLFRP
ncbi:lipoprotein [Streptomyces marokkonensis]|uniref:Lipoprotein n=1 Tax=Streptomyces marokkonensis TaxID=324855 RepID=A0ABP7PFF4_9ACTN